jgi:hypothetical protein
MGLVKSVFVLHYPEDFGEPSKISSYFIHTSAFKALVRKTCFISWAVLGDIGKINLSFKWSSLFWSHNSAENALSEVRQNRTKTIIYVNEVNRPRDLSENRLGYRAVADRLYVREYNPICNRINWITTAKSPNKFNSRTCRENLNYRLR